MSEKILVSLIHRDRIDVVSTSSQQAFAFKNPLIGILNFECNHVPSHFCTSKRRYDSLVVQYFEHQLVWIAYRQQDNQTPSSEQKDK